MLKHHCRNGVVNTFGSSLPFYLLSRIKSSKLAQENIIPAPLVIETAWLGLADLILGMTLLLKKSSSLILQCVIAVASEVTLPRLSAIFPKHSCEEGVLKTKIIIIIPGIYRRAK